MTRKIGPKITIHITTKLPIPAPIRSQTMDLLMKRIYEFPLPKKQVPQWFQNRM